MDHIPTCAVSTSLLKRGGHVIGGRPGRVPSDGNCLFNSLSVLVCGDTDSATEIRHRTAVELIMNSANYSRQNKWISICGSVNEGKFVF